MQKIKYLILAIMLLPLTSFPAMTQTWLDSADVRIDSLRKGNFGIQVNDESGSPFTGDIRIELIDHEFAWGGVIPPDGESQSEWSRAIIAKYFNTGVTGNVFKWPWVEPDQGSPSYEVQDEILDWAEQAGLRFRGHTLIWGGDEGWQMPDWTLDGSLTPEEIYAACEAHITRDVSYWKGRVDEYDVINEPVHETWLAETVGDSVNWNSFKWAHTADSNAVLYVNDFNIIVWGSANDYRNKIETMLANGAPIGGIGVQAHMEGSIDWTDVKEKLDFMAELGIPIRVTEFDMKIDEYSVSEADMAVDYATMLRTAFSHPAVNGFVIWAIWDNSAYRAGSGIYDEDRIPKPAADSLYQLIHEKWTTRDTLAYDAGDDTYNYRGFYGDYRVTVDYGDDIREFTVPALKLYADSVFVLEYDSSAPATASLLESRISKDADGIEMIFDRNMDFASFAAGDFSVYSDKDYPVTSFEALDTHVVKVGIETTLFLPKQFFAIYYNGDTARTADTALLNHFGPDKVINNLPAFERAETDTTGELIRVTFSRDMDAGVLAGDFSITSDGNDITINAVALDIDNDSMLVFIPSTPVQYGESLRVTYTEGNYHSADGYKLVSFGPKYVHNNVPNPNPPDAIEEEEGFQAIAYPDPFRNALHFENLEGIHVIRIYDSRGALVDEILTRSQKELVIRTEQYPEGVLIARLIDSDYRTLQNISLAKE